MAANDDKDFLADKIMSAISRYEYLEGMRDSFNTDIVHQDERAWMLEGLEDRRERAREARKEALTDPLYLQRAISRLEANGVKVRLVHSREGALQAVLDELGGERFVVKSKSNITKEIGLTDFLFNQGIEVVETDAGDRIVQLSDDKPVHPTGPAANYTRYDVARILSEHLGREVDPDPRSLLKVIREEISGSIQKAEVGITGVNFISAEDGSMVIVHNEGNVSLCARRPKKHIAVSAVEKIVPKLEEAMNLVRLQTFYATGSISTSYVDVISGPSRTADIEKKTFYGVHGPEEVVLVLMDYRRDGIEDREVLYCINCGGCLLQCPVYDVLGREFGGQTYLGGRGLCFTAELDGMDAALEGGLTMCTNCGLCTERCPVKIDTPGLVRRARQRAMEQGLLPTENQQTMINNIRDHGHPWPAPSSLRTKWADGLEVPTEGDTLYFAGCFPSIRSPEVLQAALDLLKAGGEEAFYMRDETCCGSPVFKMGERELFSELASENYRKWKEAGVKKIVTSCAGCFNMISSYRDHLPEFDIPVEHITQTVACLVKEDKISFGSNNKEVTYHDPCDLGRHMGVFKAPREIAQAIPGLTLIEMDMNREKGNCCGAGAGVRKTHPELAKFIASKRVKGAAETGAACLVTACPFCEDNFRKSLEEYPQDIEVLDLIVLARDSLNDDV